MWPGLPKGSDTPGLKNNKYSEITRETLSSSNGKNLYVPQWKTSGKPTRIQPKVDETRKNSVSCSKTTGKHSQIFPEQASLLFIVKLLGRHSRI